MKVLHTMWQGTIGGAERAVYQLIRSQIDYSDFRPTVAYAQGQGYYADRCRQIGCTVIDLSIARARHLWTAARIKKEFSKFDIHHFHAFEPPMVLGSLFCKGATRIYTHRGGFHKYPLHKRIVNSLILRRSFHGFTGNTKHACKIGARQFHIHEDAWDVTYNGLDFSIFEPESSAAAIAKEFSVQRGENIIIGTTANLRKWKRIDYLLSACAKLSNVNYQLLIVGNGPDRDRLESMVLDLGIRDKVIFTGMQKKIGDFLQLMDVFVLPSDSGESFGNSVVEAMAQGIPSIVMVDGGGLPEHINHDETGYIANSESDLFDHLDRLVQSEDTRSRLGDNARNSIRTKYTLENLVRTYDQVYKKAIASNAKS